jgi:hypothetical protein
MVNFRRKGSPASPLNPPLPYLVYPRHISFKVERERERERERDRKRERERERICFSFE